MSQDQSFEREVWGSNNTSRRLRHPAIAAEQTTKTSRPLDAPGSLARRIIAGGRWTEVAAAMRPLIVVVLAVLAHNHVKMSLIQDQHPVQRLPPA